MCSSAALERALVVALPVSVWDGNVYETPAAPRGRRLLLLGARVGAAAPGPPPQQGDGGAAVYIVYGAVPEESAHVGSDSEACRLRGSLQVVGELLAPSSSSDDDAGPCSPRSAEASEGPWVRLERVRGGVRLLHARWHVGAEGDMDPPSVVLVRFDPPVQRVRVPSVCADTGEHQASGADSGTLVGALAAAVDGAADEWARICGAAALRGETCSARAGASGLVAVLARGGTAAADALAALGRAHASARRTVHSAACAVAFFPEVARSKCSPGGAGAVLPAVLRRVVRLSAVGQHLEWQCRAGLGALPGGGEEPQQRGSDLERLQHERAHALHRGADGILGIVCGVALLLWRQQIAARCARALVATHEVLYGDWLEWLSGTPGGLKLNRELATAIVSVARGLADVGVAVVRVASGRALDAGAFARSEAAADGDTVADDVARACAGALACVCATCGASLGAAALADVLAVLAMPLRVVASAVALAMHFHLRLVGALVGVARGRKWNAARERYDAYHAGEDVLIAGAFALTVLLLLLPTALLFHTALACATLACACVPLAAAQLAAAVLETADTHLLPLAVLSPETFRAGASLVPLHLPAGLGGRHDGAARLALRAERTGVARVVVGGRARTSLYARGAWRWLVDAALGSVLCGRPPEVLRAGRSPFAALALQAVAGGHDQRAAE